MYKAKEGGLCERGAGGLCATSAKVDQVETEAVVEEREVTVIESKAAFFPIPTSTSSIALYPRREDGPAAEEEP